MSTTRSIRLLSGLAWLLAACSPAAVATEPATAIPVPTQAPATQAPTTQPPTPTSPPPTPTAVVEAGPVLPIGAIADWTATEDATGIQGQVEVLSERELIIRDFVSLVAEAPGVDIRLGIGGDFSDEVAVRLKDITGQIYEGRSLRLRIPDAAFGRTFDSIAVFCFATGELFDAAVFQLP